MKQLGLKSFAILLLIFLVSVVVRLPNINRPLSKHHEFTTAFILRIQQIWWQDGVSTFHFNPVMNYGGRKNKYINNQTFSDFDKNGNSYYISYPAGAYLLPYFFFRVLNIYPDVIPLQSYNLFLQFIQGVIFFQIIQLLLQKQNETNRKQLGFVAVIFLWFNSCTLWFFSNVYMVDMPAAIFFTACVYSLINYLINPKWYWLLTLFCFNLILGYTEYLGLTFSIIAALLIFIQRKNIVKWFLLELILFFSSVVPFAIMFYQYSLIKGWKYYQWFFTQRYATRSGYNSNEDFISKIFTVIHEWIIVGENYLIGFGPLLILALIFLFKKKESTDVSTNPYLKKALILFSMPVLLHHIIFLNASLYDFFVVKAAPFLVLVLISMLIHRGVSTKSVAGIVLFFMIANLSVYYFINRPGSISQSGDRYDMYQQQASFINSNSNNDEVIFLKGISDEPQLIFYAKRNIRTIMNETDAIQFLKMYKLQKGIIFSKESDGKMVASKLNVD